MISNCLSNNAYTKQWSQITHYKKLKLEDDFRLLLTKISHEMMFSNCWMRWWNIQNQQNKHKSESEIGTILSLTQHHNCNVYHIYKHHLLTTTIYKWKHSSNDNNESESTTTIWKKNSHTLKQIVRLSFWLQRSTEGNNGFNLLHCCVGCVDGCVGWGWWESDGENGSHRSGWWVPITLWWSFCSMQMYQQKIY